MATRQKVADDGKQQKVLEVDLGIRYVGPRETHWVNCWCTRPIRCTSFSEIGVIRIFQDELGMVEDEDASKALDEMEQPPRAATR